MAAAQDRLSLHATALAYGRFGLLLTGAPGSGKSGLARSLIDHAVRAGGYAALVADDRVDIKACSGRLIARAMAANRDLIEVRGIGLFRMKSAAAVLLTHAVVLDPAPPRLPEAAEASVEHLGVSLPVIHLRVHDPDAVSAIAAALGGEPLPV